MADVEQAQAAPVWALHSDGPVAQFTREAKAAMLTRLLCSDKVPECESFEVVYRTFHLKTLPVGHIRLEVELRPKFNRGTRRSAT